MVGVPENGISKEGGPRVYQECTILGDGLPGGDAAKIAGTGTSALPPPGLPAATAITFWKWMLVSRVYTPLLRWLLDMGLQKVRESS
jgi:hypothetical protein